MLVKNRALSAAESIVGFRAEMALVMVVYGAVKDIRTIARLRLMVKPMFRNKLTNAEPMPRRCMGRAPITLRRFGAKKRPVPMPMIIMYSAIRGYAVASVAIEKRMSPAEFSINPVIVNLA